jgi:hypothetical protein
MVVAWLVHAMMHLQEPFHLGHRDVQARRVLLVQDGEEKI